MQTSLGPSDSFSSQNVEDASYNGRLASLNGTPGIGPGVQAGDRVSTESKGRSCVCCGGLVKGIRRELHGSRREQ